jgi:undecaprenyl pyrophosphate phosphatase UppP
MEVQEQLHLVLNKFSKNILLMLKLKHMKDKNNQRGFIKFIILIIIVLVIGQLLGFGPIDLLTKVIIPGLLIVWKIILLIVHLIVKAIQQSYDSISNVPFSDLVKSFNK